MVDRTLLAAEGILQKDSITFHTSVLMATDNYKRENDIPKIGTETIKAGTNDILNATTLAYLFLGLHGQLGRIPEVSEDGLFDGKKKAIRQFILKFGNKRVIVSFIFKSPELRELRKNGQDIGILISSMSVSALIRRYGL